MARLGGRFRFTRRPVTGGGIPAGVLAPSDFTYLGYFRLPYSLFDADPYLNHMFQNSRAHLTGRRYDGNQLQLIVSGGGIGANNAYAAYEVRYPGVGTSLTTSNLAAQTFTGVPTASVVRKWNNVVQRTQAQILYSARVDNPNTAERDAAFAGISGLGYIGNAAGNGTQLEVGLIGEYAPVDGDCSRMSVILNDNGTSTSYGPWRVDIGAKPSHGAAAITPSAFTATHPLAKSIWLHTQARGGQQSTSRGANCVTYTPPVLSTPADVPTLSVGSSTIATRKALFYDVAHAQARNTDWRYEEGMSPSGCAIGGGTLVNPSGGVTFDPAGCDTISTGGLGCTLSAVFGGHPNITSLDWTNAAVWINGPNKRGFFVVGQLTDGYALGGNKGHYWYGSGTCCHGQASSPFSAATGPASTFLSHWVFLFDPQDFGNVVDGSAAAYSPTAYYADVASNFAGWGTQLARNVTTNNLYQLSGAWFDEMSSLLFVSHAFADPRDFDIQPVIHVFSVNC